MVEARQARPREMTPIGGALARAFHDDPVMSWLLGEGDAARLRKLRHFMTSEARRHHGHDGLVLFGLRVTGEITLPDGPPLWSMWRDPR
jgi:hypothetical protein